jgi:hypothetical protein
MLSKPQGTFRAFFEATPQPNPLGAAVRKRTRSYFRVCGRATFGLSIRPELNVLLHPGPASRGRGKMQTMSSL